MQRNSQVSQFTISKKPRRRRRALATNPDEGFIFSITAQSLRLLFSTLKNLAVTMANAGLASAQMLPRFLLPKLSWQAAPAHRNTTIRALSTISTSCRPSSTDAKLRLQHSAVRCRANAISRPKSTILDTPAVKRSFHRTARQSRDHHFDTLKFVQRLQEEGFTEAQAVAMMKVLSDVIEERFVDAVL